jgi:hypothetical protein
MISTTSERVQGRDYNFPYPDKLEMSLGTKTTCDIAPDDQISVFSALYAGSRAGTFTLTSLTARSGRTPDR